MRNVRIWPLFAAGCLVLAADPAGAAESATGSAKIALICRLRQTGEGSVTDFIRRLEIDQAARTVTIADDLGRGFQPLPLEGMLLRANASEIVFDYVDALSIGRSVIRRRSGRYRLRAGKFVTRGSCAAALPDSGVIPNMP